jgi:hypothetical protein
MYVCLYVCAHTHTHTHTHTRTHTHTHGAINEESGSSPRLVLVGDRFKGDVAIERRLVGEEDLL